jgi:SAM-dependent methyltransferase
MNPFARALCDFHSGSSDASFVIRRDDGFEQRVSAAAFFKIGNYPPLESRALEECYGKILDIGSAAGRHSLELVRRGLDVTSLDILPEVKGIMNDRGLSEIVIADVFQFHGARFDTLLMLMNGIGITGNSVGLIQFLQHAHDLIVPGGQILCDSIDVGVTEDPRHIAYREHNLALGRSLGQQTFTMEHDSEDSIRFDWLHIDFQSLSDACEITGWTPTLLSEMEDGHYVCRLIDKINKESHQT